MCAQDDFGFGGWAEWFGPAFGGHGRRGRHRGRHGFRARVFDRGDLKYVILRLLRGKPMHGYEIMQALEEESGGWYTASPGTVYPALQMLQDQGYVVSEEKDGKRVYSITDEGRAFLETHSDRLEDVMGRVSDFAERFSGGDMGELGRSFMRLATVSWEEAFKRMGDPAKLAEWKEIIERATREMRGGSRSGRDKNGEASHA